MIVIPCHTLWSDRPDNPSWKSPRNKNSSVNGPRITAIGTYNHGDIASCPFNIAGIVHPNNASMNVKRSVIRILCTAHNPIPQKKNFIYETWKLWYTIKSQKLRPEAGEHPGSFPECVRPVRSDLVVFDKKLRGNKIKWQSDRSEPSEMRSLQKSVSR